MSNDPSPYSIGTATADEVRSYRAISRWAVISLVCGLLSWLAFASPFLLWAFPAAALVSGVLGLRQIARAPGEWAGTRLAQFGMGMAIICWAAALSLNVYSLLYIRRYGIAAANRFVNKLKAGELEDAFWLTVQMRLLHPGSDTVTADELPREFMMHYMRFRMENRELAEALADPHCQIELETVESVTESPDVALAAVVYKVHSPKGDSRLLVVVSSMIPPGTSQPLWYIRQHEPNYTPQSFRPKGASGHGHAH